jgi:rhodanese-related sulfurtransferase
MSAVTAPDSAPASTAASAAAPHGLTVGVSELQSWMGTEPEPRIIDVREPSEFGPAHIPGAYNVPLGLLKEHRHELREHLDQQVVLVCRSGNRATEAAQALAGSGLTHLHVLTGGMVAWEQAGAPVNRTSDRWAMERQVRLVAGSLVAAGVLGSLLRPELKWLSATVGAGLMGAAATDSCMMAKALQKLPYNRQDRDFGTVMRELAQGN